MTSKKYVLYTFVFVFFCSFLSQDSRYDFRRKIWVYQSYHNSVMVYKAKSSFPKDAVGYQMLDNAKLRVRQQSNWCGTSPMTYEMVKGEWEMSSDSILTFEFKYLYEVKKERRKIVKLTEDIMVLQILN